IHPQSARQGYITEVVTATIDWLFAQGVAVIKAGVAPENTASIQLLKKLGFEGVGEEEGELIFTYSK
ncbi:MAG: GNAT family N-acetyltransferase, partial [Enterococcus sp.]